MLRFFKIPDCYDPVAQAEQREAEWDSFMEKLPICTLCGTRIRPGDKVHAAHSQVVCASCVEILNDDYEILEEENL